MFGARFISCDRYEGVWHEIKDESYLAMILHFEGSKWVLEQIPHFNQCLIVTVLALERYVFVCFSTRAKELVKPKRRIAIYVMVTMLFILMSSVPIKDIFSDLKSRSALNQVNWEHLCLVLTKCLKRNQKNAPRNVKKIQNSVLGNSCAELKTKS